MENLSKKQKKLLCFIKAYIGGKGEAPLYTEMLEYMGLMPTSKGSLNKMLKTIEEKGHIKIKYATRRGIEVL